MRTAASQGEESDKTAPAGRNAKGSRASCLRLRGGTGAGGIDPWAVPIVIRRANICVHAQEKVPARCAPEVARLRRFHSAGRRQFSAMVLGPPGQSSTPVRSRTDLRWLNASVWGSRYSTEIHPPGEAFGLPRGSAAGGCRDSVGSSPRLIYALRWAHASR